MDVIVFVLSQLRSSMLAFESILAKMNKIVRQLGEEGEQGSFDSFMSRFWKLLAAVVVVERYLEDFLR